MVGDQIAEEMLRISFRHVGKLTSFTLKKLAGLALKKGLWGLVKKGAKAIKGVKKHNIEKLSQHGEQLSGIEVDRSEIAGFDRYARKYKLEYSLIREKNDPEQYFLTFKAKDINKLEMVYTELTKSESRSFEPLCDKIEEAKARAYSINTERQVHKQKSRDVNKSQEQSL